MRFISLLLSLSAIGSLATPFGTALGGYRRTEAAPLSNAGQAKSPARGLKTISDIIETRNKVLFKQGAEFEFGMILGRLSFENLISFTPSAELRIGLTKVALKAIPRLSAICKQSGLKYEMSISLQDNQHDIKRMFQWLAKHYDELYVDDTARSALLHLRFELFKDISEVETQFCSSHKSCREKILEPNLEGSVAITKDDKREEDIKASVLQRIDVLNTSDKISADYLNDIPENDGVGPEIKENWKGKAIGNSARPVSSSTYFQLASGLTNGMVDGLVKTGKLGASALDSTVTTFSNGLKPHLKPLPAWIQWLMVSVLSPS